MNDNTCKTNACTPVQGAREETLARTATPRHSVETTDGGFQLRIELPGVPPEAIQLRVEGGELELETPAASAPSTEGQRLLAREFDTLAYQKTWRLPREVDVDAIRTHHAHGVLTVELPLRSQGSRTIPVLES